MTGMSHVSMCVNHNTNTLFINDMLHVEWCKLVMGFEQLT